MGVSVVVMMWMTMAMLPRNARSALIGSGEGGGDTRDAPVWPRRMSNVHGEAAHPWEEMPHVQVRLWMTIRTMQQKPKTVSCEPAILAKALRPSFKFKISLPSHLVSNPPFPVTHLSTLTPSLNPDP